MFLCSSLGAFLIVFDVPQEADLVMFSCFLFMYYFDYYTHNFCTLVCALNNAPGCSRCLSFQVHNDKHTTLGMKTYTTTYLNGQLVSACTEYCTFLRNLRLVCYYSTGWAL